MNDPTSSSSPAASASASKSLPQPESAERSYVYKRYDDFSSTLQSQIHSLTPECPCRLMLSKGINKSPKLSPHTVTLIKDENGAKGHKDVGVDVDGDEERVTVKYPKGSTYHVKKKYILPLTQENNLIIVSPETTDYRKLCIVQTPKDHSFIEIGCAFGFTVGDVDTCDKRLGIDKSPSSLEIAKKNYPTLDFEEIDVLTEGDDVLLNILDRYGMNDASKLIVGIDINGNRELEAVIQCLQRILDIWQPRLVIVKSRSLFNVMLEQRI
jgi:hypothetical protein